MTDIERVLVLVILVSFVSLSILIGVLAPIFLTLLPLGIQPILLGVYAQKIERRVGIIWALIALTIDIRIVVFFEMHVAAQLITDAIAEVSTVIIIGTWIILTIFVIFRQDGPNEGAEDFSFRLRRGVFRIWVSVAILWTIFCAVAFYQDIWFFNSRYYSVPRYLHIGKWFIGVPLLVFVVGLAACWVVDGFRKFKPQNPH